VAAAPAGRIRPAGRRPDDIPEIGQLNLAMQASVWEVMTMQPYFGENEVSRRKAETKAIGDEYAHTVHLRRPRRNILAAVAGALRKVLDRAPIRLPEASRERQIDQVSP
jgi:hypothetical protein